MSISKAGKVYFVGIGGIGMSALARLCKAEGKAVGGSDRSGSLVTEGLEKLGVKVFLEQVADNISDDIDVVVYSAAVPHDQVELITAHEKGIRTVEYCEALGESVNPYHLLAVTGTHGKSTTTAMLTEILEAAELDPTAIIGSLRSKTGSNFRTGKSKYAVVEADDYQRHFLHLRPEVLVITNLEYEHVDYYKDLADVQSAFRELALKVPESGTVIADVSDPNLEPVITDLKCQVIDYREYFDPLLKLKQPGLYNQLNAAAAIAGAKAVSVKNDVAKEALENFAGIWRRFEYKGEVNGAPVYDDYAHHPTEIEATLGGAKERYPDKKIITVFQSHTYSRTHALLDQFVGALSKSDEVIMLPIYAAREENVYGVTATQLVERINTLSTPARYFDDFDEVVNLLRNEVDSNSVVIVMGAGEVTKIASMLTT